MARTSPYRLVLALNAAILALPAGADAVEGPAAGKLVCFPTNETREEIKAHRLVESFVAVKNAAAAAKAEALSAKLCRMGDEFVYEIALLHRDGRLVHVVVSAATGKLLLSRLPRETPPRN